MTYYWIVAKHSGKVLDVEEASLKNCAKIIQYTKKSGDDPSVDNQLWSFNGGFIINKNSGLVLDVTEGTQIIQFEKHAEPACNQEWDYNHEDNTISLRSDRGYVPDIRGGSQDDVVDIILFEKHGGTNQQFILEKWNDTDVEKFGRLATNIIDYNKFLPKFSQNLLEILDDDEVLKSRNLVSKGG